MPQAAELAIIMTDSRGRSYTRPSEPNYPVGFRRYNIEPSRDIILPDSSFTLPPTYGLQEWNDILQMDGNMRDRDNICGVDDLENYQGFNPSPWSKLPPPDSLGQIGQIPPAFLYDSGSSSGTSPDRLSRVRDFPTPPSSMTSLDGSYGTIPGEEIPAVQNPELLIGAPHNTPLTMGLSDSWHSMVDTVPPETPQVWEMLSSVTSNGSNDAIREQHACEEEQKKSYFCDVPDCRAARNRKSFSRLHDLKRHKIEQHSSGNPRFICGCCRKVQVEKYFVRKDRVLNHLRSRHNMDGNTSRRCPAEPCYIEGINQEVHFASQSELDQHLIETHEIFNAVIPKSNSEQAIPEAQAPNSNQYDCQARTQSSGTPPRLRTGTKHTIPSEPQPEAKRGKRRNSTSRSMHGTSPDLQRNTRHAAAITTSKDGISKLDHQRTGEIQRTGGESGCCDKYLQDWPEPANLIPYTDTTISPIPSPQGYEQISSVRIIDMLALLRLDGLQITTEGLKPSQISFSFSDRIIKLQGPSSATKLAKGNLEDGLKEVRRFAPSGYRSSMPSHGGLVTKHSARSKSKLLTGSCHGPPSTKIFALGANEEDSANLVTWMKHIEPNLHDILAPAVGENYSASLVRQGFSVESSIPTIRIQSASGQSEDVRMKIRAQVRAICEKHGRTDIPLHFSKGSVTLLSGSHSEYEKIEDGQANEQGDFPHHRRYWKNPGMGSSIGLGSCKTVSATLGGYISIDKRIHMLTVDHFIDYATDTETATGMSRKTVTSPSLLDVEELTDDLSQTIRDTDVAIENLAKQDFPSGEVTLEELRCHGGMMALMDNRDLFEAFLKDLSRNPQEFCLGEIRWRCVPQAREAIRAYRLPTPDHENIQMHHRMDWSISTVNRSRAGQNRHRHKFCTESGTVDFLSENLHPLGAGSPCQQTCDVEPNVPVYYVGQSSGRQSGKVSAVPVSVACNGKSSKEWAIVVPEDKQREGEIYCGDSGAWILRESDNALVGLLWGWINGQLIFTPIKDVFEDIKETCNATEVCLPKPSTAPDPGALNICRVGGQAPRKPRSYSSPIPLRPSLAILNGQLPRAEPAPISPPIDPNEPRTKADPANDRSPSPVPSLSSSISSSQKTTPRSTPEPRPQPDCNSDKTTVMIGEDGDAGENSEADEKPQLYSPLQLPRGGKLGKNGQEYRLSIGYLLENKSFAKSLAMLASPEPPHEALKRGSGTWPSVETWRRDQGIASS